MGLVPGIFQILIYIIFFFVILKSLTIVRIEEGFRDECYPGYASPSPTLGCVACPAGTFTEGGVFDSTECIPCPVGTYSEEEASFFYTSAENGYGCYACPPGTTTSGTGRRFHDCKALPTAGYYSPTGYSSGQAQNIICPPGSYCPVGGSAPVPCPHSKRKKHARRAKSLCSVTKAG